MKPKPATRAQMLAKTLMACSTQYNIQGKRQACERAANKTYGAPDEEGQAREKAKDEPRRAAVAGASPRPSCCRAGVLLLVWGAPAARAEPWWHLESRAAPTYLPPGGKGGSSSRRATWAGEANGGIARSR